MEHTSPRNPFKTKRFLIAAATVGVLALGGVLVAVIPAWNSTGEEPDTAPDGTSTAAPTRSRGPGWASVCGLPGYEEQDTLSPTTPPVAEWSILGTIAVPESATAGPGLVDGDRFRSCYAHTAEGALFAAVNLVALSSDAQTMHRLPELVAPGPGRDAAIAQSDPDATPSSSRIQLAGYRITSYTANQTVVDTAWAVTSTGGQLVSFPIALVWAGGDWKADLADNGQQRFSAAPLQSLGGYIPWAGI